MAFAKKYQQTQTLHEVYPMNDIKLGILVILIVQFISVIGVIYLFGKVC